MKKNIIITGASRGLGQAIAEILDTPENQLILLASKKESFSTLKAHIHYMATDLQSFTEIEAAAAAIKAEFGHIDVLINNAGMYIGKPLAESQLQELEQLMQVNFAGPAYLTQQLLPLLEKGQHPQIINISSIAAKKGLADLSFYAASKAAVTGFSNALRAELNPKGIRVCVLHPTAINTWQAPNPEQLLAPEELAKLINFILMAPMNCQFEELVLSVV